MRFAYSLVALSTAASLASAAPAPFDWEWKWDWWNPSSPKLPKGAFELEGYGKTNPIGPATGGKGGPTKTVTSIPALITALTGDAPLTVVAKGEFNLTARLRIGNNKSLIGHKDGAHIFNSGITVANVTNVVIRNMKITQIFDNDGITLANATRVWIDHNEFFSGPDILADGPDKYDGQVDIIRASDWITVSWNYFHDHWKSSLVGNNDQFRAIDFGHLHVTYHHNYWRNEGTRGNAGRFGHQHLYNNFYKDFHFQAIHSRSDNQVLVEGNVFRGDTKEALSTYGLVIPMDSPNTSPDGDYEIDGFANLGAKNDWGPASINITQKGNFYKAPYKYKLTPLSQVEKLVVKYSGLNKIWGDD